MLTFSVVRRTDPKSRAFKERGAAEDLGHESHMSLGSYIPRSRKNSDMKRILLPLVCM